ncbi:hypothetical protein BDY17DRAFT_298199 [Neohortaea acidophila]|uniref:Uncharacterized protein n=1 Tax=Neohortaea acidophila TaxID=245834 RepID=A0A6A6PQ99_9PEZI|nr:uncharacterized protein BDY17DRAFT_298199 [Neohortaea acidophila]KAF2482249.1 hypothetical protein BDY17DRAFT_298199 [Neohortaea acidophila]
MAGGLDKRTHRGNSTSTPLPPPSPDPHRVAAQRRRCRSAIPGATHRAAPASGVFESLGDAAPLPAPPQEGDIEHHYPSELPELQQYPIHHQGQRNSSPNTPPWSANNAAQSSADGPRLVAGHGSHGPSRLVNYTHAAHVDATYHTYGDRVSSSFGTTFQPPALLPPPANANDRSRQRNGRNPPPPNVNEQLPHPGRQSAPANINNRRQQHNTYFPPLGPIDPTQRQYVNYPHQHTLATGSGGFNGREKCC